MKIKKNGTLHLHKSVNGKSSVKRDLILNDDGSGDYLLNRYGGAMFQYCILHEIRPIAQPWLIPIVEKALKDEEFMKKVKKERKRLGIKKR